MMAADMNLLVWWVAGSPSSNAEKLICMDLFLTEKDCRGFCGKGEIGNDRHVRLHLWAHARVPILRYVYLRLLPALIICSDT